MRNKNDILILHEYDKKFSVTKTFDYVFDKKKISKNLNQHMHQNDYFDYIFDQEKGNTSESSFSFFDDVLDEKDKERYKKKWYSAKKRGSVHHKIVFSFREEFLLENNVIGSNRSFIDEEKLKQIARNGMQTIIKKSHYDLRDVTWIAGFHYNTKIIHVHFSMIQNYPEKKQKYTFDEEVFESAKDVMYRSISSPKLRKKFEMLADSRKELKEKISQQNISNLFSYKELLEIKTKRGVQDQTLTPTLRKKILEQSEIILQSDEEFGEFEELAEELQNEKESETYKTMKLEELKISVANSLFYTLKNEAFLQEQKNKNKVYQNKNKQKIAIQKFERIKSLQRIQRTAIQKTKEIHQKTNEAFYELYS